MDKSNISKGIPPEVLALLKTKLMECGDAVAPYIVPLKPEERRAIYKAADGSESFLGKAISYADLFPKLVPQQLDTKEMETMYGVLAGLMPVVQLATTLAVNLTDTKMVAGSETMRDALSFYNNARQAARENVADAKTVYGDMKKRYERKKKSEADEVLTMSEETEPKAV